MANWLFGYGSLLSLSSASRTVGRKVTMDDFVKATLTGYVRTWTCLAPIVLNPETDAMDLIAAFLDLTPSTKASCNGVLIDLSDDELVTMDLREAQYERVNVSCLTASGNMIDAFTYRVPEHQRIAFSGDCVVLRGYVDLIEGALRHFSSGFVSDFWKSTAGFPSEPVEGHYAFSDPGQNRAAGRD